MNGKLTGEDLKRMENIVSVEHIMVPAIIYTLSLSILIPSHSQLGQFKFQMAILRIWQNEN